MSVIAGIADRVAVMRDGVIVEEGDVDGIYERPRHPYTRMLLDAVPDLGMSGRPRTPVRGEVPNPLAPPPGCTFHPRCPHSNERCRREVPLFADGVACHAIAEGRI
jgi:peptide/nickel transport system ATP-binding protein